MAPGTESSPRLRVRLGTAVVPCGPDVVFTAGAWQRRIRGKDAQRAVLPVARLLDGSRTVAELPEAAGLDPRVVAAVIKRLSALGLLESAEQDSDGGLDVVSRAFLRKVPDRPPVARTPAERELLLSECAVTVVARDALADRLVRDLRASGVGTVRGDTVRGDPAAGDPAARRALVLVEDTGPQADAVIDAYLSAGDGARMAVLRFRLDDSAIEIGPCYQLGLLPAEQTCLACARAGRDRLWPPGSPDTRPGEPAAHAADLGCGLVTAEALALLAGIGPVTSGHRLLRVGLSDLSPASYLVLPEPGCPRCAPVAAPVAAPVTAPVTGLADGADGAADAYETALHVTREPFGESRLPAFSQQKVAAYQSFRLIYPSSPVIALPVSSAVGDAPVSTDRVLAVLLALAAGRQHPEREDDTARWAWSARNLGSAELFLIGQDQVLGQPPGSVLKYDDLRHALIVAHSRVIDAGKFFSANGAADMDFAIVSTGAFARLTDVCGEHAFRLGHLDAGCALAQLSAAAASLGLAIRTSVTWTDDLPGVLELSAGRETVTAVAWIRQAATPAAGLGLAAGIGQLLAILSRPQSVTFAEAPVPGAMLAAILATARQITPLATRHEPAVYVALAGPGTGGVYRTSASGALADRIAGHDVVRELHQIYAPAPALLLICGTVTGEPRLHQGALMSAAALGYSAWLAARHRGLDGGLFPDASALVTAAARADSGDGRRHLFTVALGRPASHAVKQRQEVVSLCISATSSAAMATGTPPETCGSSKRCGLCRPARTLTSRRPAPAWNT